MNIYIVTPLDNANLAQLIHMGSNVSYIRTCNIMDQDRATLSNSVCNLIAQRLINDPKASVIFAIIDSQIPNSKFSAGTLMSDTLNKLKSSYRLDTSNIVQLDWIAKDYNSDLLNQITKINKENAPTSNTLITSEAVDTEHAASASFSVSAKGMGAQPVFNQSLPSSSESEGMEQVNKYSYLFGLDGLAICTQDISTDSCFISNYVDIESDAEYITLSCSYMLPESAAIEFFIIDGTNTVPILAEQQKSIQKEKLFTGSLPLFPVDGSGETTVYKDNYITNLSLADVAGKNDAVYTVSYVPTGTWKYTPRNSRVKIKAIMRLYDPSSDAPIIRSISIKQWGGDALWQANI